MSDYKRFVSYLYCYDNGIKKNNIGYARVETRNGQCKITIHIKLLSLSNTILDTYLFYRKDSRIIGLPLCPLPIKNSVGDCQAYISSDKILDTNLPFSMIGGIIITVSQSRLLGTEWDDNPIIPSLFEVEEIKEKNTAISVGDLEQEQEPSTASQIIEVSSETQVIEPDITEAAITKSPPEELSEIEPLEADNEPKTIEIEPASETVQNSEIITSPPPIPDFLNTITNYLLIDPAYINHLSQEYAGLRQNSFVLHGYDSYRHLILAKWLVNSEVVAAQTAFASPASLESDPEIEEFDVFYQLGVPGIYSLREKAIAEKFGFAEFKTTKKTPLQYGDFGYWLVPVNF